MSSSLLSRALSDHDCAVLAAVGDITERLLYTCADPMDPAAFDEWSERSPGGCRWIASRVEFDGPTAGWFTLTLPEPLARRLAASFAGLEDADGLGEAELCDFAGELTNMACGSWLTNGEVTDRFVLSPPRFHIGALYGDPKPAHRIAGPHVTYAWVDDAPLRISVSWTRYAG